MFFCILRRRFYIALFTKISYDFSNTYTYMCISAIMPKIIVRKKWFSKNHVTNTRHARQQFRLPNPINKTKNRFYSWLKNRIFITTSPSNQMRQENIEKNKRNDHSHISLWIIIVFDACRRIAFETNGVSLEKSDSPLKCFASFSLFSVYSNVPFHCTRRHAHKYILDWMTSNAIPVTVSRICDELKYVWYLFVTHEHNCTKSKKKIDRIAHEFIQSNKHRTVCHATNLTFYVVYRIRYISVYLSKRAINRAQQYTDTHM